MWDWVNCVVLFRHEYGVWCRDGAIFLRCMRCGHRSQGWDVESHGETDKATATPHRHRRFPVIRRLWAHDGSGF